MHCLEDCAAKEVVSRWTEAQRARIAAKAILDSARLPENIAAQNAIIALAERQANAALQRLEPIVAGCISSSCEALQSAPTELLSLL